MTVSPTVVNMSSADAGVMLNAAASGGSADVAQKGAQRGWQEIFAQVLGTGPAVSTTSGETKTPVAPAVVVEPCAGAMRPQVAALEDGVVKPGAPSVPATVRGSGVEASQPEPVLTSGAGHVAEAAEKEESSTIDSDARMLLERVVMATSSDTKATTSADAKISTSGAKESAPSAKGRTFETKARGASVEDLGKDAGKIGKAREGSDDLAATAVAVPVGVPVVHVGLMPVHAGVESEKADGTEATGGAVKGLLRAPELSAPTSSAHVVRGEQLLPTQPGQVASTREPATEHAPAMEISAEKLAAVGATETRPAERLTVPMEGKEAYAATASAEARPVVQEAAQQQAVSVPAAGQALNREATTAELRPEKIAANSGAPRVEKRGRVAEMQTQGFAKETGARVEFAAPNAPQSEATQGGASPRNVYVAPPSSQANVEVRDAFGAIDRASTPPSPTWIHAGTHRAEAGYLDPSLGWVSVRAEAHGGMVQASLIPGSNLAAAELGGHLPALNAHLAQSGTDANVLMGSLDAGAGRGQQQGSGGQGQTSSTERGAQQPLRDQTERQVVQHPMASARASGNGNLISVVA